MDLGLGDVHLWAFFVENVIGVSRPSTIPYWESRGVSVMGTNFGGSRFVTLTFRTAARRLASLHMFRCAIWPF